MCPSLGYFWSMRSKANRLNSGLKGSSCSFSRLFFREGCRSCVHKELREHVKYHNLMTQQCPSALPQPPAPFIFDFLYLVSCMRANNFLSDSRLTAHISPVSRLHVFASGISFVACRHMFGGCKVELEFSMSNNLLCGVWNEYENVSKVLT